MNSQEIENIESQCKQISEHLVKGGKITSIDALKLFGCWNLKGRIFDLRKKNMPIHTEMIRVGRKRVALYSLERN